VSQWIEEGNDYAEAGDHAKAIELFTAAVAQGETWVGLNLGNSYDALGNPASAKSAFESAWTTGGVDDAGLNLAYVFETEGDIDRARAIYRTLARTWVRCSWPAIDRTRP